jgi:hypothetical protein
MRAAVYCPADQVPEFSTGSIICSGGGSPSFVVDSGLGVLAWSDVALLMGALLVSVALAAGYSLIGSMMWGKR